MIHEFRRIMIVKLKKPSSNAMNADIQWFCQTLGLFGMRDKNSSCFRIFIELLKAAKGNYPLASDDLAYKLDLSRGTVIHHLQRLIESGLVSIEDGKYILRVSNLEDLVSEIKKDTERVFGDLREMAKEIDFDLGLARRKEKNKEIVD